MRTTSITIHNNQELEIFVEKREEGFELWVVGPRKGCRMVLHHYLTHDDLEANLEYAKPGDLVWRDASPSEIPTEKHRNVIEMEKTIEQGTFVDHDRPELDELERKLRAGMGEGTNFYSHRAISRHLSPIDLLTLDKKEVNTAKKLLIREWTDGFVTLTFATDHKLQWSCADPSDLLCLQSYDSWNSEDWGLFLWNTEQDYGTSFRIMNIDAQELHLQTVPSNRLVRILHRDATAGENVEEEIASEETMVSHEKRERVSHPVGKVLPLLRQLEEALIERNPIMSDLLNPGLPESEIRTALIEANISVDIEALVQLYSWSNGTARDEDASLKEISLFPESIYMFMSLEDAIISWRELNNAVEDIHELFDEKDVRLLFSGYSGQLFPVFTDTSGGEIAIDLTPSKNNRVMLIDFEIYGKPKQAYGSFDSFIKDAIRANQEDDALKCFQ